MAKLMDGMEWDYFRDSVREVASAIYAVAEGLQAIATKMPDPHLSKQAYVDSTVTIDERSVKDIMDAVQIAVGRGPLWSRRVKLEPPSSDGTVPEKS